MSGGERDPTESETITALRAEIAACHKLIDRAEQRLIQAQAGLCPSAAFCRSEIERLERALASPPAQPQPDLFGSAA